MAMTKGSADVAWHGRWILVPCLLLPSCGGTGGGGRRTDADGGTPSDAATRVAKEVFQPSPSCLDKDKCLDTTDCPAGHRCNLALTPPTCQELYCGTEGTACSEDGLCVAGATCFEGACRLPGHVGEVCGFSLPCVPGLVCGSARDYSRSVCFSPRSEGAPCDLDGNDCKAPLSCQGSGAGLGQCLLPEPPGSSCIWNSECTSKTCFAGTCTDVHGCTGPADSKAVAGVSYGQLLFSEGCPGLPKKCTSSVSALTAASGACVGCLTKVLGCGHGQCSLCDADPSTQECRTCLEAECGAYYSKCSGLDLADLLSAPCVPTCKPDACGSDGCGGTCGAPCGTNQVCDIASHVCVPDPSKIANCFDAYYCALGCTGIGCDYDCEEHLPATESNKYDALKACEKEKCSGEDGGQKCFHERCASEVASCAPSAYGTASCASVIQCTAACESFTCVGACLSKGTEKAIAAWTAFHDCDCDSFTTCWNPDPKPGGACGGLLAACN